MKIIKHNDTFINVGKKGHFFLSTEKTDMENFEYGYINANLMVDANYEAEYERLNVMPTDDFFVFNALDENKNGLDVSFNLGTKNLKLTENVELIDGLNVIKQKVTVKNNGKESVRLARLTPQT